MIQIHDFLQWKEKFTFTAGIVQQGLQSNLSDPLRNYHLSTGVTVLIIGLEHVAAHLEE